MQHPGHDLREEGLEGASLLRKRLESLRFALRSRRCCSLATLDPLQTSPVSMPG